MRQRVADALKIAVLAGAYLVTAKLGLHLDAVSGFATLVWAPSGIALAALLLHGYRLWPGIALGAFLVNQWAGAPPPVAAGIAIGNTLEAVVATYLLHRFVGIHDSLDRVRDVVGLATLAAGVSTMVSATIGVASLALGGHVAHWGPTWFAWWWGDLTGDLLVAPLLLTWSTNHTLVFRLRSWRWVELAVLTVSLVFVATLVFIGWPGSAYETFRMPYFVFPLLIWGGLRFGTRGAATASFVANAIALYGTVLGHGPFALAPTLSENLFLLQSFLATSALATLILGASAIEQGTTAALKGAMLEAALDAIVTIDHRGDIREFNASAERLFGLRRSEVIGEEMAALLIPPRLRERHRKGLARYLSTGEQRIIGKRVRFPALHADGTEFPVELTVTRVATAGSPTFTAFIRDITGQLQAERAVRKSQDELEQEVYERTADLRDSLRDKEVLLREIHHRVKNNLQVIASLLNLQATTIAGDEARRGFEDSQSRIQSMALVHQLLYQAKDLASIDFEEYLRDIVERLAHGYGVTASITFDVRAPNVRLDIDTSVPCGLIVNELVSNSLRHAFPGGRRGHVAVLVERDGEGRFVLTVKDDGVGISESIDLETVRTLGLQVVRSLTRQLRGTIEVRRDRGTTFRIIFPGATGQQGQGD